MEPEHRFSKQHEFPTEEIFSVLLKKVIVGLDLEAKPEPTATERLVIYLLADSASKPNSELFIWRIHGVKTQTNETELVYSLVSFDIQGKSLGELNLPDKHELDRKLCFDLEPEKTKWVLDNPKMGFKNALGQDIQKITLSIQDGYPYLDIFLTWHYYLHYMYVTLEEEEYGFALNLSYD